MEEIMLQAHQIATLDNGRAVYRDYKGALCREDVGSQCLVPLTKDEENELSKTLKRGG